MVKLSFVYILFSALLYSHHSQGCHITSENLTWDFDKTSDTLITDIESVQACRQQCSETDGCLGYTFEEGPINFCFLFKELTNLQECTACISGTMPTLQTGSGCSGEADHIISQTSAASASECLELCAQDPVCGFYTWFDSTSLFKNTCFLYSSCPEVSDCSGCESGTLSCIAQECIDYNILDDETRNVDNGYANQCDQEGIFATPDWKGAGWYRVMPPAGTFIAETDPGRYHCGTDFTGYATESRPDNGQKSVTVCFDYGQDSCRLNNTMVVTSCGSYHVYYLEEVPSCRSRYCTADD